MTKPTFIAGAALLALSGAAHAEPKTVVTLENCTRVETEIVRNVTSGGDRYTVRCIGDKEGEPKIKSEMTFSSTSSLTCSMWNGLPCGIPLCCDAKNFDGSVNLSPATERAK